jgi:D-aminoacyl-tRNA deacylase
MRAVVQRVLRARVSVDDRVIGEIGPGLAVLVGVAREDGDDDAAWIARKLADLRVFSDSDGKFNLSLSDVGGDILLVSQFTLLGDAHKGRRPSFVEAAARAVAEPLFDTVAELLKLAGFRVETGQFAARMLLDVTNDGPVTILLDSRG